jgi:hypothetical protein
MHRLRGHRTACATPAGPTTPGSHALNHSPCQPAWRPTAVSVEIPDTTIVINMLNTNGMAIALRRGGNFCIQNLPENDP